MRQDQLLKVFVVVCCTGLFACNNDKKAENNEKKTAESSEGNIISQDNSTYQIVKDSAGDIRLEKGGMIAIHYKVRTKDTMMMDSRVMNGNHPIEVPYMPGSFKGDLMDGLKLLTAGDSAVFHVPFDSIKKYNQGEYPEYLKEGDMIDYEVQVAYIKSPETVNKESEEMRKQQMEMQKKQQEQLSSQLSIDDKKLQAYFAKNNIKPKKTQSGMYYTIEKEGHGPLIAAGKAVSVNYTGYKLNGEKFDSNTDPAFQHTEPFTFLVGQRMVIPGWDEGIQHMKEGSKGRFFIPSPLGYGPQGSGAINPNEVLIFDIEIKKVMEPQSVKQ